MDVTEFVESEYLTVDMVDKSILKKAVVLSSGNKETSVFDNKERTRLVLDVGFDTKFKKYSPNKDSLKNIISAWGSESENWKNKLLILNTYVVKGKKCILAIPSGMEVKNGN